MHAFSCHMHMHTCSSRGGGGRYEVVAEPQEPQGPASQEEVRGESAQGPANPRVVQQMQGKPRCMSYYFKL